MGIRRLAASLLLVASSTWAIDTGFKGVKIGDFIVCPGVSFIQFLSADANVQKFSDTCRVTLLGPSCLGSAANQYCNPNDLGVGGQRTRMPRTSASTPEPTLEGEFVWNNTEQALKLFGAINRSIPVGTGWWRLGGNEVALDFTYNGENSCSGDVCRGGTCPGGGVCELGVGGGAAAFFFGGAGGRSAGVFSYRNMTIQSGTVRGTVLAGTGTAPYGAALIVRVAGTFAMSGGTLDMSARGVRGVTNGGTAAASSSQTGRGGGATNLCVGGAGGNTSGGNGGAPVSPFQLTTDVFPWLGPFVSLVGAGGGAPANAFNAGQSAAPSTVYGLPPFGGCGGGGGGTASASTCNGALGEGGRGGGVIHLEIGDGFNFTTGTIDVRGQTPTGNGAGGGGGGGVHVLYRRVIADAGTYLVVGGAGGPSNGSGTTLCGAGGTGSNGAALRHVYPY